MFTNWQKTYDNTRFQMQERLAEAEQHRLGHQSHPSHRETPLQVFLRKWVARFRNAPRGRGVPLQPALSQ